MVIRTAFVIMLVVTVLMGGSFQCPAAPPGPADLVRSIETARKAIADNEKILTTYGNELRTLVGNDQASAWRREEIRILKQHYVHENEALKAKIADEYKKIQEFKARGLQQ